MQENEFKIILTKDKYQSIKDAFEWDSEIIQVNHYYDTIGLFLYGNDITFRIREKEKKITLQIKHPDISNNLFKSRMEEEYIINEIPNHFTASELKKYINELELNESIYLIGQLKTKRLIKQFDNNIQICLDKNSFFRKIDYELEIEFKELTDEVNNILDKLSLTLENSDSKYKRFINYYQKSGYRKIF